MSDKRAEFINKLHEAVDHAIAEAGPPDTAFVNPVYARAAHVPDGAKFFIHSAYVTIRHDINVCGEDVMPARAGIVSDKPVWCETWAIDVCGNLAVDEAGAAVAYLGDNVARARLAAAAPAMVRALLAAEWGNHECSEGCGWQSACGVCDGQTYGPSAHQHYPGCSLDAALAAAGLKTQAERDAAREMIRGGSRG